MTRAVGPYTVGQRFQTSRASGFIAGAGQDAAAVVAHISGTRLGRRVAAAATGGPL